MDCSGLVYAYFKAIGINLPRESKKMALLGKVIKESDLKIGDLLFFKTTNNSISHVAIVEKNLQKKCFLYMLQLQKE